MFNAEFFCVLQLYAKFHCLIARLLKNDIHKQLGFKYNKNWDYEVPLVVIKKGEHHFLLILQFPIFY